MRRLSLSINIVWILLLCAGTAGAEVADVEAKDGYDLFQQALLQERVEGDLEAAIERYQRIVENFGDNRPLAATALVQIGQCWEKLGNAEAGEAYAQVLRDYADQLEQVATARNRLAALAGRFDTELSSAMVTRRIWAGPEVDLLGSLDRAGRYLTFVDWTTGDLAVRELATGKVRRLTDKGPWSQSAEYAVESVVSPDGRQVTFGWVNEHQNFELRTMGIDGSRPQVLYANEEVLYVFPFQWSPDGTQILALFARRDRTHQIGFVSVSDGSVRVIKTLDWREPVGMSLSPDGRLIAYAFPKDENTENHDVFVLAADGSRETRLVQHPADDVWPIWTAAGKHVLFNSDRTGAMGTWAVEVADGLPLGTPKLIKSNIGHSQPLGVTAAGSYYYGIRGGMTDVYTAEIDVATGELLSPPAKAVERFTGSNHFPAWSPDGRYLAYISSRGGLPIGTEAAQLFISIRSLETGEEREFSLDLDRAPGGYPNFRWSPDGDSFLFNGIDAEKRVGLYRIDVKKGDVTAIVQEGSGFNFPGAVWSSDGRSVFYSYVDTDSNRSAIYTRALDSGVVTKLSGQVFAPILSVSPDGRQIAFISGPFASTDEKGIHLKIMPSGGGEARTLLTDTSIGMFLGDLAWTPDGEQLLFVKRAHFNEEGQSIELWRISSEGGEPQRAGLALVGLNHFQLHPDGRRIAFTVATGGSEVWVMENFLTGLSANR